MSSFLLGIVYLVLRIFLEPNSIKINLNRFALFWNVFYTFKKSSNHAVLLYERVFEDFSYDLPKLLFGVALKGSCSLSNLDVGSPEAVLGKVSKEG